MKISIMAAVAAIAFTATAASAIDLGQTGIQFNSDVVAEYNTGTEDFIATYTPELRYIPLDGLSVYAKTDLNLENIDFTGMTVGAEYVPAGKLDLVTYVKSTSDADFNFDSVTVGAEFKF